MSDMKPYWFPAKRYGWGWGPPCAWQGWVVLVAWCVALALGAAYLTPQRPVAFCGFLTVMIVCLLLICYKKGEPPKWRWGKQGPGA